MQTIVLDGVEYIKAAAAAKNQGYTADYVGQLCRAKKIDARLIGRTWFVVAGSLAQYKQDTHDKSDEAQKPKSNSTDISNNIKISRVKVAAPLKNKTAKSVNLHRASTAGSDTLNSEINYPSLISYRRDNEDLLPTMQKQREISKITRKLRVEPAATKKLKIRSNKNKHTAFSATEMPDVALSGKLKVSESVPDDFQETELADEIAAVTVKVDSTAKIANKTPRNTKNHKKTANSTAQTHKPGTNTADINLKLQPMTGKALPWRLRLLPVLLVVFAVTVALLLLTIVAEVKVSDVPATSGWSLDLSKLKGLFPR